eukprot:NODE_70_length_24940_cov_0.663138.p25 type:complete len:110 gc:universal NODE_70_length_24940_cov_0.663138:1891-1562(-)
MINYSHNGMCGSIRHVEPIHSELNGIIKCICNSLNVLSWICGIEILIHDVVLFGTMRWIIGIVVVIVLMRNIVIILKSGKAIECKYRSEDHLEFGNKRIINIRMTPKQV